MEDEILQWLYQNCFAFIFPSFFEGFGLPVLEAMSLGAPVISFNVCSIPEIVGQAGVLIEPASDEALYKEMWRLATNPELRSNMKDKAIQQASQFSWRASASAVLECYQEVLGQHRIFSP